MTEFTSSFWSIAITVITLVSIIACGWLAWSYGRTNQQLEQKAEKGEDTGHVWDGDLVELNNPLPRWWLWMFYISVIFSLAYLALYPGLGAFQGLLGWSQENRYAEERARLTERTEAAFAEFTGQEPEQLASNARALSIGHRLFLNNCAQCHGSDARGSRGYPNLTNAAWLYGGTAEALRTSIAKGRHGFMPPQAAAVGGAAEMRQVAAYVRSLSGVSTDASAATLGKPIYLRVCAACHGAEGQGNQALGAPSLADRYWLYGGSQADIIQAMVHGREGVMPAHEERLSPQQIDLLVAYVLNLSGQNR
ncbi:MAG: cytochrome-c oxidase, cbb3-type subunit III [Pigmentiphaga sp.]|nr:cytochrome-c oxidase, cbb3-type subunit III [Pigmentiphaga sp.]